MSILLTYYKLELAHFCDWCNSKELTGQLDRKSQLGTLSFLRVFVMGSWEVNYTRLPLLG